MSVGREFSCFGVVVEEENGIGEFVCRGELLHSGQEIDVARRASAGEDKIMRFDSALAVELEDRDGVVSPVGGEEKAFIFGKTDCGGFRGSLKVGGEGGDRVQRVSR